MTIKITQESPSEEISILRPEGAITIKGGDLDLREAVRAAKGRVVILNLAGVTTVDASGIGELVASYTILTNRGQQLVLLKLPARLDAALRTVQLIDVFTIYEDEQEAIASFG